MRAILKTNSHVLASFEVNELITICNSLNETLNNSNIDELNCECRIGVPLKTLKQITLALNSSLNNHGLQNEIQEFYQDNGVIMCKMITATGDPIEMSDTDVEHFIQLAENKDR